MNILISRADCCFIVCLASVKRQRLDRKDQSIKIKHILLLRGADRGRGLNVRGRKRDPGVERGDHEHRVTQSFAKSTDHCSV